MIRGVKEGSLKLFTESCYCGHISKAVHFLHFLKEIWQQSWLDKLPVFSQKKSKIWEGTLSTVLKLVNFAVLRADLFCGANRFCWLHCWSMIPRWPSFKAAKHNLVFQLFRFCISTAKIEFQYTSVFVQVADFLLNDLTESETQKEMSKWFAFKILPRSCLRSCPPSCPPVCPPSWPQVVPQAVLQGVPQVLCQVVPHVVQELSKWFAFKILWLFRPIQDKSFADTESERSRTPAKVHGLKSNDQGPGSGVKD